MDPKTLLKFLFELGNLRRIKHEGWRVAGVDEPESVADHSLRAAQIGYFLAKMENYPDPNVIATMLIFHDIGECRIGDLHKIARRYIETTNEDHAVKEQLEPFGETGDEIFSLWSEVESRSSDAGVIAKDADLLEQALSAKEYLEKGYAAASDWITNIKTLVKTDSARMLLGVLFEVRSYDWMHGLKKL